MPWRTLTGRQHFYLDHEAYRAFGEALPAYKPRLPRETTRELDATPVSAGSLVVNCLTPHGKWHIHSTYSEDLRMLTLSRGIEPLWMNDHDAGEIGVDDNDWVEMLNDNGAVVTRACVSARIPRGVVLPLPRDGADGGVSAVAVARPSRRLAQQRHPAAAQAGADGWRLCAALLPLQRLRARRVRPRHVRRGAPPAGAPALLLVACPP